MNPQIIYNRERANEFFIRFKARIACPEAGEDADNRLRSLLNEQLHDAYRAHRSDSLHALHVSLHEILHRRFNNTGDSVERAPLMFEMQQQIIQAQLSADLRLIGETQLPESADQFERWFNERSDLGGRAPHRLFDFIEIEASLDQFRRFIAVEASVHVSFDDVIALAQVGVRGEPRREFFRNLQDEIGTSDSSEFHLTMFENLVTGLGVRPIDRTAVPWEALTCGNYMMFLSYFRHFYPYCIGYLGHLEALTPARFGCIARGGARLGVTAPLLAYHSEHSELDAEHAQGWLRNVILPAIRANDSIRLSREIATGVLLRECVSQRYWNAMLAELTAEHPTSMR